MTIRENQCDTISRWLRDGKTITPKEAMDFWGIYRLAAVIHLLRKDQDEDYIITTMVKVPTRYYGWTEVARYHINPDYLEPRARHRLTTVVKQGELYGDHCGTA